MEKVKLGILLGLLTGIVDLIPMVYQKLTWDANLSAFTFWIINGIVIATTNFKIKGWLKGMVISLMLFIPLAFIIGGKQPISLIPILIMNVILGTGLGYFIEKWGK